MSSTELRRITGLPLFPLPEFFLFPGALVPLHIYEPRYRQMVDDLLDTAGRLVMASLDATFDAVGAPPGVFPLGGLAEIVSHRRLEDGRYLIWILGLERVRITEIDSPRLYRRSDAEVLEDDPGDADRNAVLAPRLREAVTRRMLPGVELNDVLDAGLLSDILFQHLPMDRARKEWALAERNVTRRALTALAWLERLEREEADPRADEAEG
jgi:Lon protease-like protein